MKAVLTIAGSDSCGGAGIQADLKTMIMNGVYGTSAITALTAQNTMGVRNVFDVEPDFLKDQMDAVFEDIYPSAVKIGMVSSTKLIEVIAQQLKFYQAKNIVLDPVMVATSGSSLMEAQAVVTLKEKLIPIADIVTPNIYEAQILSGITILTMEDMRKAAKQIGEKYECAVLLKGGHSIHDADDLLFAKNRETWFKGKRIDNPNTHGTGCTLSSAIAANLAKGLELEESVMRAKQFVSGALSAMLNLGRGSGPLNHGFNLSNECTKEVL